MKNDNQIILDKLYKMIKFADLLNSSLRETANIVEDKLDSDGDEIIDDLSRTKDCIIKFYRCIRKGLLKDRRSKASSR